MTTQAQQPAMGDVAYFEAVRCGGGSANPESVGDDVVSRLNRYAEPGNLAAVHPAVQQTCRDAAATIATLQAEAQHWCSLANKRALEKATLQAEKERLTLALSFYALPANWAIYRVENHGRDKYRYTRAPDDKGERARAALANQEPK